MTSSPDESPDAAPRTIRDSAAEYAASMLRSEIAEGRRHPGDKLPEPELCESYQVSRNTLREAFQLLTRERLVAHRLNKGFRVRRPAVADLADIFRVRRVVEVGAVRAAVIVPDRLAGLHRAVADGEGAARRHDGRGVGSANIRFHRAIGALVDSDRVDELMRQVLAELRLVFHVMGNPGDFHLAYLPRNREILASLAEHDILRAAQLLSDYLDDAEHQLRAAYRTD